MSIQESLVAALAILMTAAVLLSPAACTANRHNQIAKAIEAGADPLEAKCAIEGGSSQHNPVCIQVVGRRK